MPVNSFSEKNLSWIPPREATASRPVYLALAASLEDDILSGLLCHGTKLPPQRELADFLDIDFTTVTRAYNVCRDKGLIYGVTGRGTFVSSARSRRESGAVDCSVVQSFPEAGSYLITEAARDVLARSSAPDLFSYRDRDGSPSSIAAARRYLAYHGIDAGEDGCAVFPGAQGAISAVLIALFRPGDTIAVDEFTYSNLISLARLAHIKLLPVKSDDEGMSASALEETAEKKRVKGLYIMPHEANPTGKTLSRIRKQSIADVATANNILLIEDDATLVPREAGGKTLFSLSNGESIYIAGSTRNIAPGLRATYMAFPKRLSRRLLDALHHLTIKAGALDAEILSELILSGKAREILAMKAEKAREANALFDAVFPYAPKSSPTALFRCVPLPGTSGDGPEIEERLFLAGVKTCHSDRFSVRAGNADSFLRVSLSSAPSLQALRTALETIAAFKAGRNQQGDAQ